MVTCRICKKPFLDVPNVALDKIFTLIALPCKYGSQGCITFVFQTNRLQHETVCQFRPVSCQFQHLGCQHVLSIKDMASHHKICRYSDKENKKSAVSFNTLDVSTSCLLRTWPPTTKFA